MKRTMLLIASLPVFIFSFAQTADTIVTESLVNGTFQNNSLQVIHYNAACSFNDVLNQTWDINTATWVNSNQGIYQYDDQGHISAFLSQNWDAAKNKWMNNSRNVINTENGTEVSLQQNWDMTTHSWADFSKTISTFAANGAITSQLLVFNTNGIWQKNFLVSITYDAQNRPTEVQSFVWQNDAWANSGKTTFNYNGNGLIVNYYWDANTSTWIKSSREITEYLPGTMLPQNSRTQQYTGNGWQNAYRNSSHYELYNGVYKQSSYLNELWDAGTQHWVNFYDATLTHYNDGALSYYTFRLWDAGSNTWGVTNKSTYTHNNSCILGFKMSDVAELQQSTDAKGSGKNSITQTFNSAASATGKLQYDVQLNGTKQYGFHITLSAEAAGKAISSTSSDAIKTPGTMLVSPNPAKAYFTVNTGSIKNNASVTVQLADLSGRTVLQQKLTGSGQQKIMLPTLPKGVYTVTVIAGKEIQKTKLVIE